MSHGVPNGAILPWGGALLSLHSEPGAELKCTVDHNTGHVIFLCVWLCLWVCKFLFYDWGVKLVPVFYDLKYTKPTHTHTHTFLCVTDMLIADGTAVSGSCLVSGRMSARLMSCPGTWGNLTHTHTHAHTFFGKHFCKEIRWNKIFPLAFNPKLLNFQLKAKGKTFPSPNSNIHT